MERLACKARASEVRGRYLADHDSKTNTKHTRGAMWRRRAAVCKKVILGIEVHPLPGWDPSVAHPPVGIGALLGWPSRPDCLPVAAPATAPMLSRTTGCKRNLLKRGSFKRERQGQSKAEPTCLGRASFLLSFLLGLHRGGGGGGCGQWR